MFIDFRCLSIKLLNYVYLMRFCFPLIWIAEFDFRGVYALFLRFGFKEVSLGMKVTLPDLFVYSYVF